MWNKLKIVFYASIPIILYFVVMFIKSKAQKRRVLNLARHYVNKEVKIKQEKISKLEKDFNNNQDEILKLKNDISRKEEKFNNKREEVLSDKDIVNFFG